MLKPGNDAARVAGLDVARGIAIAGTLATNIWIFSHPEGLIGYFSHPTTPGASPVQAGIEKVLQQLANGKFLGLLTIMFGIGLAVQADAAARRGRRWPGSYLWRAALLFLDGVLNYILVVEFDILMGYAVTAAIVAYLLATSGRTQRVWFGIAAWVHVLLIGWLTAASLAGFLDEGAEPLSPNPYRDGSWWDLVLLRLDNAMFFRFETVLIIPASVALFLAGSWLWRGGLFSPAGARLRTRLMVVGAAALSLDLVLGLQGLQWTPLTRWLLAPIGALGILALIAKVTLRGELGWLCRRLAELGRVALSAYILQNVIASVIFYGWGFGLNAMAPAWRLPVTVATWLVICVALGALAHWWLGRFARGPLEWLWAVSYRRLSGARRLSAAARVK